MQTVFGLVYGSQSMPTVFGYSFVSPITLNIHQLMVFVGQTDSFLCFRSNPLTHRTLCFAQPMGLLLRVAGILEAAQISHQNNIL